MIALRYLVLDVPKLPNTKRFRTVPFFSPSDWLLRLIGNQGIGQKKEEHNFDERSSIVNQTKQNVECRYFHCRGNARQRTIYNWLSTIALVKFVSNILFYWPHQFGTWHLRQHTILFCVLCFCELFFWYFPGPIKWWIRVFIRKMLTVRRRTWSISEFAANRIHLMENNNRLIRILCEKLWNVWTWAVSKG